jgi:glucan biosynthesis protein
LTAHGTRRRSPTQRKRQSRTLPSWGYDAYRGIRFRPESILWRDSGSKFHVEFFPTGFLYQTPVKMYVIRRGDAVTAATALSPSPEMFDFGAATPPASVGFAGFKVTHPLNGQKFDEIVSFLGGQLLPPNWQGPGLWRLGARAGDRHRTAAIGGVPGIP